MVVSLVIENSRFGLALLAIRQNELAAEAAGINARLWKMRSLVVSGMMAAVAGGFYARVLLVVTPDSVFGMLVSAQAVVVTLFGGVASVWGPVIGAAILVPLAETLQAELGTYLPGIQGVVYGVAIIAVMLLSPDGLFWTVRDRWFHQKAPASDPGSWRTLSPPARRAVRPTRGRAAAGGRESVARLRRAEGGQRGELLGRRGRDPRHHRAERRGQDDAVQRAERRARRPTRARPSSTAQPMLGRKTFEVCRMGVGRTFQVVRSFPRLPVLDNVIVGAYGAGLSDRDAIASAVRALHQVGLQDRSGVAAGQLTNKQLRLMELARALAGHPRLLLLDETLAGLGREECDDVLDVLARLRERGHDDLHHRAYNARDDAPRRPVRGAGPRPRARHRACRAPSSRTTR